MSRVEIYNTDCKLKIEEMLDLGIQADCIMTDAPYLISKPSGYINNSPDKAEYIAKYGKHTIDFGEWDKTELDLDYLFTSFYRLLKEGGTILFFYDGWKMQEIKECALDKGFKQPRLCEWVKTNPVPINSKLNYLSNAKEYFITFVKKAKPTFNSQYHNGIFSYPICGGKERTKHPTQKPLKLIEELLSIHTNENDLVLDCFMGSGTTGVACQNTNRNFIGIELDENYFKIAKTRLGLEG